jgi:hypothetical protein
MISFRDFCILKEFEAPAASLNNTVGMGNVEPTDVFIPYKKKKKNKKKKWTFTQTL